VKDVFWTGDFAANLVAELFGAVVLASVVAFLVRTMQRRGHATRDLLAWAQTVRILRGFFMRTLGEKPTAAFFTSIAPSDSNAAWRAADAALASAAVAWADGQAKPTQTLFDGTCLTAAAVYSQLRRHVELFSGSLFEDETWVRLYLELDTWVRTLEDPLLMKGPRRSVKIRRDDMRSTVRRFVRVYSQAASNMHDLIEMHTTHGEPHLPLQGGWRGVRDQVTWWTRRGVSRLVRLVRIPRPRSEV